MILKGFVWNSSYFIGCQGAEVQILSHRPTSLSPFNGLCHIYLKVKSKLTFLVPIYSSKFSSIKECILVYTLLNIISAKPSWF